jgi:hypothetical protein
MVLLYDFLRSRSCSASWDGLQNGFRQVMRATSNQPFNPTAASVPLAAPSSLRSSATGQRQRWDSTAAETSSASSVSACSPGSSVRSRAERGAQRKGSTNRPPRSGGRRGSSGARYRSTSWSGEDGRRFSPRGLPRPSMNAAGRCTPDPGSDARCCEVEGLRFLGHIVWIEDLPE